MKTKKVILHKPSDCAGYNDVWGCYCFKPRDWDDPVCTACEKEKALEEQQKNKQTRKKGVQKANGKKPGRAKKGNGRSRRKNEKSSSYWGL